MQLKKTTGWFEAFCSGMVMTDAKEVRGKGIDRIVIIIIIIISKYPFACTKIMNNDTHLKCVFKKKVVGIGDWPEMPGISFKRL